MATKWVMVRTLSGALFVIERAMQEHHVRMLGDPYDKHIIVADSDDRAELVMLRDLAEVDE